MQLRRLSAALVLLSAACAGRGPVPDLPRAGMVRIPAGRWMSGTDSAEIPALMARYRVGRPELFADEVPKRSAAVAAFWLDRFEAHGPDSLPLTNVTWAQADAHCAAQGKRLPTELEWEWAARGGLPDPEFPWGNDPADGTRANYGPTGIGAPTKVGRFPPNGYGLYDMAGNVWEFTATPWPGSQDRYALRGGSFGGASVNLRVRYRDSHRANAPGVHVGFRCAG